MILVTGAAGKTGCAILSALQRRGAATRALVRREQQRPIVESLGAGEVVIGDMQREDVLVEAMRGVQAVYHIGPNMNANEAEMGRKAVSAAKQAGVKHFVYHSVLHPQTETMPHHWHKLGVEEELLQSGLEFTILQPAAYMQNLRGSWSSLQKEGVFRVPYPVTTALSLVHLADVAEVAVKVLTESGHEGATYELVGTRPLSQIEVANTVGERLNRLVRAEEVALDEWRQQAEASHLSSYAIESLLKMFRYYAAYGFAGNTNVLRWLLEREPTPLAEYVQELAQQPLA